MFGGFSEKTSEFLWELSFNNERPWFAAHKAEFEEYMNTPFKALAKDVFTSLSESLPTPGWQVHVSRIYRDSRRLYGRPPFNDHLWFTLWRADLDKFAPCFWFELDPRSYRYGMGFWALKSDYMQVYRSCIEANPARFERLVLDVSKQDYVLGGESYKKPKGDLGAVINPWYNRKSIGLEHSDDFGGEILRPEFAATLAARFKKLMPMYDFMCEFYRIATAETGGNADEQSP